jgi:hypothetical protein
LASAALAASGGQDVDAILEQALREIGHERPKFGRRYF